MYPQAPETGVLTEEPVSRQVFSVQDLEIRDRLASSMMNKFLYLYSSKEMPRKAHSNMVQSNTLTHNNLHNLQVVCMVSQKFKMMFSEMGMCCLCISVDCQSPAHVSRSWTGASGVLFTCITNAPPAKHRSGTDQFSSTHRISHF